MSGGTLNLTRRRMPNSRSGEMGATTRRLPNCAAVAVIMGLALCALPLVGLGAIVEWDHFGAKDGTEVTLGVESLGDGAGLVRVALSATKGHTQEGVAYVFYRLTASRDSRATVVWSRPVMHARDWLCAWDCALSADGGSLGLVALGSRTACFYEIPLQPAGHDARLVRHLDIAVQEETTLALDATDRLRCAEKLGSNFRHISSPLDADLEGHSALWTLRLKFRQPRRTANGDSVGEVGVEHETVDAAFTKAVSRPNGDWVLSSVVRESLEAARCRYVLSSIEASKKRWFQGHPSSEERDGINTNSFQQEFFHEGLPSCPDGGHYSLGTQVVPATCSLHGTYTERGVFAPTDKKNRIKDPALHTDAGPIGTTGSLINTLYR